MTHYAAQSDPARNPNLARRWTGDPLDDRGLRHLGDEVAPLVVEGIGRRAIACWLDKAAQARNREATDAFCEADNIRRTLSLDWRDLIDERWAA